MNILDKQVMLQFMEKRVEMLKKLILLDDGSEREKLEASLREVLTWKTQVELGEYDVKVW